MPALRKPKQPIILMHRIAFHLLEETLPSSSARLLKLRATSSASAAGCSLPASAAYFWHSWRRQPA